MIAGWPKAMRDMDYAAITDTAMRAELVAEVNAERRRIRALVEKLKGTSCST
jgi:hypothetical protein